MKSTQKTVTEYLEKLVEDSELNIMVSHNWANMGTWMLVNEDGLVVSSLKYDFQSDYVTFGGFGGSMYLYQGQYHLVLKHLREFVLEAREK